MAGLNTEWLMLEKKAITIRFAFQDILEIGWKRAWNYWYVGFIDAWIFESDTEWDLLAEFDVRRTCSRH